MNYFNQLFSEELIYALGWTVIHSLWQAIAVAALMTILMIGLRDKSAKLRYAIANFSLLAVLLLSVLTFLKMYHIGTTNQSEAITLIINGQSEIIALNTNNAATTLSGLGHFFDTNMPFIVLAWFMGILFFTVRLMGGFVFIQYLKSTYIPLSEDWKDKMYDLMDAIPMHRAVELAESALVRVPMVVGHIKPIILLPLGAINQLEMEEVEAIIAHELAHIVRNDYFFNILQSIVEILFYYNPAVWWISANIRTERENCCDDMAISLCGNSLAYAKALVKIQEIQQRTPRLAMAFAGSKNQLLNRVKRILNQQQNKSMTMEKLLATCLLLLTAGIFTINANSANTPLEIEEITPRTIEDLPSPEFETLTEKRAANKLKPTKIITLTNPLENSKFSQPTVIVLDTVPTTDGSSTSRQRIRHKTDDEDVDISIVNGEIKKLIINGKRIAKEDYPKYQQFVDELANDVPAPPAPPAPPSMSMPPAPPAPPAPPVWPSRTIRNSKSSTSISIDSDEGETSAMINGYELKREKGADGKMRTYWDGKELEDGTITKWENGKLITRKIDDGQILSFEDGDSNVYIKTDEDGNTEAYSFNFDLDMENASDEEILAQIEEINQDRKTAMKARKLAMKEREREMKIREKEMEVRAKEMEIRAEKMRQRTKERAKAHEDGIQSSFRIEGNWENGITVQTDDAAKQLGEILLEERLIDNPDDYSFVLKRKKITVNGKTITGAQVEKIRDLMERKIGIRVHKGSTMKIHRGDNDLIMEGHAEEMREISKEHEREMQLHVKEMQAHAKEMQVHTKEMESHAEKMDNACKQIGQILLEEGLIDDVSDYTFMLNHKKLIANGKTVTGAQVEKIKDLIERRTDISITKNSTIELSRGEGKNDNRTHIAH